VKHFPWGKTGALLSHDDTDLRCDYFPRELCREGEEPEFLYYLWRRQENGAPDMTMLAIDEAAEWFESHSESGAIGPVSRRMIPIGATSRPPLERMTRVHEELKGKRFPNCKSLSAALEVSVKTIQRDIDFMRDRLGLPIDYDQRRFGYFYYAEPQCGSAFPLECLTKALARA
jgi:hypothetical protein